METLDRLYLQRRRRQCLDLAEKAIDPQIAAVHREFAEGYEHQLERDPFRLRVISRD